MISLINLSLINLSLVFSLQRVSHVPYAFALSDQTAFSDVFFVCCSWLWREPIWLTVGCGPKLPGGKVNIAGTVMLDGSPLICEGEGESFVNLSAENGGKGGAARFDRATGTFEMVVEPGDYIATVRATDGFEVEDEKRGTVTPAKSLIPGKIQFTG